jgi:hypothetical protein
LFVAEQLQKNCAHGKFARSRSSAAAGGGQRPTAGTGLSMVIAGHGASDDAREGACDASRTITPVLELTNLAECGIDEVRRD